MVKINFFFQAEDGIRDGHVTGVQTCALPIFEPRPGPQVLTELVEALFDLGADRPVAMPAIPELVDRRSLTAADAFVEHALRTVASAPRLRLVGVLPPRLDRRCRRPESRDDRGPLPVARPRRDLELHRRDSKVAAGTGRCETEWGAASPSPPGLPRPSRRPPPRARRHS